MAGFLNTFIGVALAGLLLIGLARPKLLGVWEKLRAAPASSLGYGALAFVGLPVAVLLSVLVLSLLTGVLLLRLGSLGLPLVVIGTPVVLAGTALVAWLALLGAQGFAAYLIGIWAAHTLWPQATLAPAAMGLIGALLMAALLQIPSWARCSSWPHFY